MVKTLNAMDPRINPLQISSIAEHPEPVLRNLLITQTYSEINLALSELLGKNNVSWCAYATWASKTAGKFIRLENVDAAIEEFLRGRDWAKELIGVIPGAMTWFGWKVKIDNSFLLNILNETGRAAATEVAKGNLLVFAELAPLYAQFMQLITPHLDQKEENLAAFLNYLQQINSVDTLQQLNKFLEIVFINCGTYNLDIWLKPKLMQNVDVGDVFIMPGSPGHAMIVADVAINSKTKERIFLLAQSYMPAQSIHIVKNFENQNLNPWYSNQESNVVTPSWNFNAVKHLKTW